MRGFVGRTDELETLNRIWSKERYKTCAIYGRRRIGKTSLIREFIRDKPHIFFDLIKGTESENALRMARILKEHTAESSDHHSIYDVLETLKTVCSSGRTVIVMDELPYLTEKNQRAASELQHFMDWLVDETESMLIVCGSSISLMLDELRNRNDPLFGRIHHEIDLGPLDLREVRAFHPGLSDRDLLKAYLIMGGVPMYHAGAGDRGFDRIVEDYLFDPSGIFYNDATGIFISELKELSVDAMSVLEAIASGHNRFGEIASRTGLSDLAVDRCLKGLSGMRVIDTLHPMAGAPKHPVYIIKDASASFFFSVIRGNPDLSGMTAGLYEAVSQQISSFIGKQFEIFCRDELPRRYACAEIGTWWGPVPIRDDEGRLVRDNAGKVLTEDADIDVVAVIRNGNDRMDLFAECKFTNRKASYSELNTLRKRVSALKGGYNSRLALISASGFEDDLREYCEDNGVVLIDADTLLGKREYPLIR